MLTILFVLLRVAVWLEFVATANAIVPVSVCEDARLQHRQETWPCLRSTGSNSFGISLSFHAGKLEHHHPSPSSCSTRNDPSRQASLFTVTGKHHESTHLSEEGLATFPF